MKSEFEISHLPYWSTSFQIQVISVHEYLEGNKKC